MVMTRPGNGVEAPAPGGRRAPARSTGGSGLPGARAIVGGLLVAVAGVCTFVAWQQASGTADRSYAVAARPIHPGESLTADDVRFEPIELPAGLSAAAFTDASGIEGRVALGPIGDGELVQLGQVSDPGQASAGGGAVVLDRPRSGGRRAPAQRRPGRRVRDRRRRHHGGGRRRADRRRRGRARRWSFGTGGDLTITVTIVEPCVAGAADPGGAAGRGHARSQHAPVPRGWLMATDRYVVLGLARARAAWFGQVARWATAAALPIEFVKTVSGEEVRARLRSGRPFSALLVDGGLAALDRDLIDLAGRHGCAVIAVDDGRSTRSWRDPRRRGRASRRRRTGSAAGRPAGGGATHRPPRRLGGSPRPGGSRRPLAGGVGRWP